MFASSDYDESFAPSTHSESISALSAHGGRRFTTSISRYVIHTHTIPLATNIDQASILPPDKSESYFHGYNAGEKADIHCPLRSCMFVRNKTKTRGREILRKNCPCYEVALENGSMKPLCFLVYVRSLNRNLTGLDPDDEPVQNIDPSEVMFCQNSVGVFDNSYPGPMRDKLGVTGWQHVTKDKLIKSMSFLYWFRKFEKQYKLRSLTTEVISACGLARAKHYIMQTLHGINSLLLKKMIAFSPEIEGYSSMAKHTAWAYSVLLREYMENPLRNRGGKLVEPTEGFYLDMKNFSNFVKSSFHKEERTERMSILDYVGTTKAFSAFFGTELRRLRAYTDLMYSARGSDYTLSPAWIFRMSTLAQTRGIGYLPEKIAECKREAFRMNVNRELEVTKPEIAHLQALGLKHQLNRGGMPLGILSKDKIDSRTDEQQEIFREAFSRIEMPIKGSASVNTFVKDGGKIEDARLLLRMAMANSWKIPVRDLDTLRVTEWISVSKEIEDTEEISRPLFWISVQLVLNHWIRKNQWEKELYHEFLDGRTTYEPNIMDASIVHISEPGKERNLTKSHAVLAWFLTPGAKLAQGTLACLKEHKAGLLESSHEWRHQKRISALSDESGFIYNPSTGRTVDELLHVFKDWTESTDFICKNVGYTLLRAFFEYVGFPHAYGRLILKTIVEPQPVVEVIHHRSMPGEEIVEPVKWKGFIREGYMMGNPITKVILHLVHESEKAIAIHFLERRSLQFRPNTKFGMFSDRARIDRKESSQGRTFHLRT